MNKDDFFKKLDGRKFLEGRPEQVKSWSEIFMVRRRGNIYYISMKNGPYQVQGTPEFEQWGAARAYLRDDWRRLYDEEFERLVLIGSEEDKVDSKTEDSSSD